MRQQCLPLGLVDNMSNMFSRDSASFSVLSFGRHLDDGSIKAREVATARLFVPHLKRTLVIGRLLEAQAVERATFRAVLDALAFAVLLVGRDLRLLHANHAGETMLRAALFDLTPTETRVLELIGAGRSNAEIATALGVAVSTVHTHVLKTFSKTGVHRRSELTGLLAAFSPPIS